MRQAGGGDFGGRRRSGMSGSFEGTHGGSSMLRRLFDVGLAQRKNLVRSDFLCWGAGLDAHRERCG